ncbi:MAG: hypothetical protein IAE82_00045, partial [Opitutaceae bacterium]|nr:hypothetical protein [Opitutaceae bacterium]
MVPWGSALLLLFCYVAYRACTLSFTHDESLSYTIFASHSGWITSANHHPLNTWLMELWSRLFGDSEFSLRLHSVAAFAVAAGVFLRYGPGRLGTFASLVGFALLFLNPFALEFFSLARGYGLAMGFIAASLHFLLWSEYTAPIRWLAAISMAALAVSANLAAINLLAAILIVAGVEMALTARASRRDLWICLGALGLGFTVLLIAIRWILYLGSLGQLGSGAASIREAVLGLTAASVGGGGAG